MRRNLFFTSPLSAVLLLLGAFCVPLAHAGNEPRWIRVSSGHFSILTDAGDKKGAEALLRLEQMRAVFGQLLLKDKLVMSEPFDVIGFRTTAEYAAAAGPRQVSGCIVAGDDRNYILLDLSDDNSWQAMTRDFARVMLRYNYPPTPAWFGEGFAEYFSSLRLEENMARLGGSVTSFKATLGSQPWLSINDIFARKPAASQAEIFRAESWAVVHYLISNNKLPETGSYFDLVEIQKVPIEQAIQQAYGMAADQFTQTIKDYFHSALATPETPGAAGPVARVQQFPALTPTDVGTSTLDVKPPEARALVAEAAARQPEQRASSVKELESIISDPATDNSVAHRGLAWVDLQSHEYQEAMDELGKAADRNHNDPWVHYYLALVKYREGDAGQRDFPGLANMMQDLRIVIDWDPEFAEAYNMLAMARLQGGGTYSALEAMRMAIQLNPGNQVYLLHLAQIYLAGKKWDEAAGLLGRLQSSADSFVASAAKQDLADLPTLKKYGVLPQRAGAGSQPAPVWSSHDDEDEASAGAAAPVEAGPDRRKTEYLQGKLLTVDCSNPPVAVVTISTRGRVRRFRADDYKSLALIGADEFSCQWKNKPVVINYKPGGKTAGDLVSLEIQ